MGCLRFTLLPASVIAKLHAFGVVALAAVAVLALVSLHHVTVIGRSAQHIYQYGIVGVVGAGDLELLLERHRRIVESAPVNLDRVQIDTLRRTFEELGDAIVGRIGEQRDALPERIGTLLPELVDHGRRVLDLRASAAQSQAVAAVADYARAADIMQEEVRSYRAARLAMADRDVADLSARGHDHRVWVTLSALAAIVLIGPMTFGIVRCVGRRLREITDAMLRLARNDTTLVVEATSAEDELGDMARALAVFKDNAIALIEQRERVEQLNGWFDIALNNMARGLSMFDGEQRLLVCNRRFQELYDLPSELCQPGTPLEAILRHHLARGETGDARLALRHWLNRYVELVRGGEPFSLTVRMSASRTLQIAHQPLEDGGCVAVHEDVTEKRIAERRIARLARVDTLTEVANRYAFREMLARRYEAIGEDGGLALLWIDLDRFKEVNDTLGHPVGDALLKAFAERVRSCVRRDDFVARLGGDEFAVLQTGRTRQEDAERLAERLVVEASRPFQICGQRIEIGASVGIALAPMHGAEPDELLKNADIALYRAKSEGRGRCVVFRAELAEAMRQRRQLELALKAALANDELELHYQPIVDLVSGRVTSCEALMRWRHPERGMIPPSVFIPVAEDMGLISEMGAWALRRACADAIQWPEEVKVAVNLSTSQFVVGNLPDAVRSALDATGLVPSRLVLEITETLLLKDDARTLDLLNEIEEMEVSFALDDFGTGYASLSYLRSFPFDKIKIDATFIRDIQLREDSVAIVRAITTLARTLGMKTVAEGVETVEHLEKVAGAGCDEVQGYLFSRPVPVNEIAGVIASCGRRLNRAA